MTLTRPAPATHLMMDASWRLEVACNARDGERGRLSECAPRRPRPRGPLLVGELAAGVLGVEVAAGVLGVEGWIAFAYDAVLREGRGEGGGRGDGAARRSPRPRPRPRPLFSLRPPPCSSSKPAARPPPARRSPCWLARRSAAPLPWPRARPPSPAGPPRPARHHRHAQRRRIQSLRASGGPMGDAARTPGRGRSAPAAARRRAPPSLRGGAGGRQPPRTARKAVVVWFQHARCAHLTTFPTGPALRPPSPPRR